MPSPFKDHPDSIAGRIEQQQLEDSLRQLRELPDHPEEDDEPSWLDIALDSTEEEVEAALQAEAERNRPVLDPFAAPLRPPGAIASCPLDRSWRRWDMFNTPKYWDVPNETQPIIDAASAAEPSSHLGPLALDWELARDDASFEPMTSAESGQPDWKYEKSSPRHLHAETVIAGAHIHVDWAYARKHGPGRSITEIRIFVDGRLAGRGGRCGCSLGFGKGDLPAVALLGGGAALTVDDVTSGALATDAMPALVAELWRTQDGPSACSPESRTRSAPSCVSRAPRVESERVGRPTAPYTQEWARLRPLESRRARQFPPAPPNVGPAFSPGAAEGAPCGDRS
ncbi:MAG: hypothetical protein NTY02_06440 [Acidobacteria bacterium]|nr:hypothetical protein [Acidobacteriota bacterium]